MKRIPIERFDLYSSFISSYEKFYPNNYKCSYLSMDRIGNIRGKVQERKYSFNKERHVINIDKFKKFIEDEYKGKFSEEVYDASLKLTINQMANLPRYEYYRRDKFIKFIKRLFFIK